MKENYNTIIIGGGVAGLTAARFLEDSLLIDSRKEIGQPPPRTGEGISHRALAMQGIAPDSSWISCSIRGVLRITPNGKVLGSIKRKHYAYIIDRLLFEKYLAEQSKADILSGDFAKSFKKENNVWRIETRDGKVFRANYIIGADGASSLVRKKIFGEEIDLLPTIQYLMEFKKELDVNIAKIYLDNDNFPQGYAWIFPKSRYTANIGVVSVNLPKSFSYFLEQIVKPLYGEINIIENRSGVIPSGGPCSKIFKDNVLLVGDAAGLTDPIFRGGMSQAMWSGRIAAQSILNNDADSYEKRIMSMPFATSSLKLASNIFYSLTNNTLNELGEVLENKSMSSLFSWLRLIYYFLEKPYLRKDIFKVIRFFYIWKRSKDYLW